MAKRASLRHELEFIEFACLRDLRNFNLAHTVFDLYSRRAKRCFKMIQRSSGIQGLRANSPYNPKQDAITWLQNTSQDPNSTPEPPILHRASTTRPSKYRSRGRFSRAPEHLRDVLLRSVRFLKSPLSSSQL